MKINLTAYRGDTCSFPFTFKDSNGAVIDITGWTIFFTLKSALDDATDDAGAVLVKTVTSHTDAANGLSSVTLSASDTNALKGDYKYDFQYKDASGTIHTIISGTFTFKQDATRRTS